MIALAGFMFVGVQSVNAQQTWEIEVTWNDLNCQCSEPYSGFVMLTVTNTETSVTIINKPWVRDDVSSHIFTGSAAIETDCDCYLVFAAVYYQDGSVCCQGSNSVTKQGQALIDGTSINVDMN